MSLITNTCKSPTCYSSVDATGKVIRGCTDCTSDSSTCNLCNHAVKCNSGIYQSCYLCKGTACISSPTHITHCPPSHICYTKLTSDGFVERGCAAEDFQCSETSCSTCSGDNCNQEVFPVNRLSCLQCNGTDDCDKGAIIGEYCSKYFEKDECFSYADDNNRMIRGCLSDDTQHHCTSSNCEKCNSTNCNNLKFNERPSKLKCYQCDDCRVIDGQTSLCKSYPFNAEEKCYTVADNTTNTVERGCYYDVANIETKCVNGAHCSICSADSCNNQSVISCYECVDCLITTVNTSVTQCTPGGFCLSKIDESNRVIRECSDKKCASEDCDTCDKDKCNSGLFPKDRQSCLQCDSLSTSDDCAKGLNIASELCRVYKKDGKCYLYVDESNLVHRGCSADSNCTSGNHCEECGDSECNKKPLYQEPELSCVQCVNCTSELPKEEKCNSLHLYYMKEECYTQNITQGNITITNRGCFNELTNQESCGANCTRCETDGCNKHGDDYKEFPDFKCVVCSSKAGEDDCANSEPKHCKPVPTSLNRGVGCFVERRDDTIIRDCLTNAEHWNTILTSKHVVTCTTDSCNTMAAPGSAVTIQLSSGLLIAFIALLFSLNNII